ncbi:MAG TPA: AtpZ/AtpI family protein [Candidatus Eisenbacteria bacterium]|nr:AtpZ/AtpI family protein [Candidatus Eisenbacteria bacterium]
MTGKNNDFYSQVQQLGIVTTIPIILLVGPAVGFWIGGWIDRKAHSYPWFTTIFTVLGFIASGREVFRLLKQISKDDTAKK